MFKAVENINVLSEIWNLLKAICNLIEKKSAVFRTYNFTYSLIFKAAEHSLLIAEWFKEVNSLIKKIQTAVKSE